MPTNNIPNRLAKEKSPYLLQHAHNPVNWFPWSEEAFDKAKQENKPVFLSIGYSTCHWCHVMERESFEDEEVAELLNRDYVAIKVDREERPDIDHIYMSVCQAMTGQGGWPLTIVMTPEKKPFFAGTYFPKHSKYGRYGLMEIADQLSAKWKENPGEIAEVGDRVVEQMQEGLHAQVKGELSEELLDKAFQIYEQNFDPAYGGFGSAPKFPSPHNLSLLLRQYKRTGNPKALEMVENTVEAMYQGGLFDHVGFGFARYSTDEKWLVPHFEKMLYDNALLTIACIETYQATGNRKYADIAEKVIAYVLRDMTDEQGGFYSAEDADSEGEEGKFYLWSPDEVLKVLGEEEGELFCDLYDITERGNFEGRSIPNLIGTDLVSFAQRRNLDLDELTQRIEQARIQLFNHRESRIHPHKDDKILTSWNGLMISALAQAARALDRPDYAEAAGKAARFLLTTLRREDGRLMARYRDGHTAYPAYLDDYAFLAAGLTDLYEATFHLEYLQEAVRLTKEMLQLFWDEEKGGLFFYGSESEQLFARPKELYDGAMPSGNSIAAQNLLRLARFTYDAGLSQKADEQLKAFAGTVADYPIGYAAYLSAVDMAFRPEAEIVLAGIPDDPVIQEMRKMIGERYLPNSIVIFHPVELTKTVSTVDEIIPLVQGKTAIGGKATAYVCENFACQAPVTKPDELKELLR